MEEVTGTAVYQNFTGKKTHQTSAETYSLFCSRNMVEEAVINPKIKYYYLTFCDVIDLLFCSKPTRSKHLHEFMPEYDTESTVWIVGNENASIVA